MTRKEAINVLKKDLQIIDDPKVTMTAREWEEHDDHMRDALEMAIEALEQEPIIHCKDCKKWVNGDDRYGICNWNEYCTLQTAKDGFCSCGKRRDE